MSNAENLSKAIEELVMTGKTEMKVVVNAPKDKGWVFVNPAELKEVTEDELKEYIAKQNEEGDKK